MTVLQPGIFFLLSWSPERGIGFRVVRAATVNSRDFLLTTMTARRRPGSPRSLSLHTVCGLPVRILTFIVGRGQNMMQDRQKTPTHLSQTPTKPRPSATTPAPTACSVSPIRVGATFSPCVLGAGSLFSPTPRPKRTPSTTSLCSGSFWPTCQGMLSRVDGQWRGVYVERVLRVDSIIRELYWACPHLPSMYEKPKKFPERP